MLYLFYILKRIPPYYVVLCLLLKQRQHVRVDVLGGQRSVHGPSSAATMRLARRHHGLRRFAGRTGTTLLAAGRLISYHRIMTYEETNTLKHTHTHIAERARCAAGPL